MLLLADCLVGASGGAGAAADAGVGVDDVDVAGADCTHGAFGLARATSHTTVTDNVSHCSKVV